MFTFRAYRSGVTAGLVAGLAGAIILFGSACTRRVSQDYETLQAQLVANEAELNRHVAEEAAAPAKETTVEEISRHPSDMPDSARHTLHENYSS